MIQTSGITSNMQIIQSSAQNIANMGATRPTSTDVPSLVENMTDQIRGEKGVEANAATVKTQDSVIGTLLDIKS